jgi:hypothetical protein
LKWTSEFAAATLLSGGFNGGDNAGGRAWTSDGGEWVISRSSSYDDWSGDFDWVGVGWTVVEKFCGGLRGDSIKHRVSWQSCASDIKSHKNATEMQLIYDQSSCNIYRN